MNPQKLTRKQIYAMRSKLKGPQRAAALRRRTELMQYKYEIQYQEQLAKRIIERI